VLKRELLADQRKIVRSNMDNMKELFADTGVDPSSLPLDNIPLIEIDLDGIDKESQDSARDLVENLSRFYYDEEFLANNPTFKKRVDTDLESLRVLIKMRKTDEVAHDVLIKAIQGNSGNASLYRAMTEIQKTILSITTKMNEVITSLNNMMKGYQLELNFEKEEEETNEAMNSPLEGSSINRGAKDFIRRMEEAQEQLLFEEQQEKEEAE
jgi:hypothetical protein